MEELIKKYQEQIEEERNRYIHQYEYYEAGESNGKIEVLVDVIKDLEALKQS